MSWPRVSRAWRTSTSSIASLTSTLTTQSRPARAPTFPQTFHPFPQNLFPAMLCRLPPPAAAAAAVATGPRETAAGSEPHAKRQRLAEADEASAMRGLMEQERQLRNRNTMLLAPNKDFRRVLEVLLEVKKQVVNRRHEVAAAAAAAAAAGGGSSKGTAAPPDARGGGGSSRYGKDDPRKAPGRTTRNTRSYDIRRICRRRGGGAKGGSKPQSFSDGGVASKAAAAAATATARGSGSGGGRGAKGGDGSKKSGVPIIIVPSGLTSMINMYNARAFLEEGRFVPAAQAQAAASGAPKPSSLTIRRTAHRGPPGVEYTLTDRAPPAGSPDWERVVAVVVQGAKWQFKDWPYKVGGAKDGDLMEALAKVCGFFVHFADEKVGPPVSDWNVRTIALHRENRHKDMMAMLELYRHLDVFLQVRSETDAEHVKRRSTWYFQQFIKLAVAAHIPGLADYFLIFDSDMIALRPLTWFLPLDSSETGSTVENNNNNDNDSKTDLSQPPLPLSPSSSSSLSKPYPVVRPVPGKSEEGCVNQHPFRMLVNVGGFLPKYGYMRTYEHLTGRQIIYGHDNKSLVTHSALVYKPYMAEFLANITYDKYTGIPHGWALSVADAVSKLWDVGEVLVGFSEFWSYLSWAQDNYPCVFRQAEERTWTRTPVQLPRTLPIAVRVDEHTYIGICCPTTDNIRATREHGYYFTGYELGHMHHCNYQHGAFQEGYAEWYQPV
ncbi:hypothetical protein VOLCADRAFT_103365 [Volvox carteri f. nagariensis]|uniref:Cell division control protein 73 C-terminal domain-containing protein n=1 Tax=Volvox carteri f. nagariensis TaxID=3068 RepID=D8TLG6_VOLCA|nr:uncharacterized protein VOLCADRAFT_103365 [Volvox carteri f. nagariensis]EFJ51730.1 hypothetical protein VOLCADRAFT_103365 [Volvox carteri f. nagariensis]|eukprot:XP_002947140.1 hypothetical protein VOLCADRAFT_103365 [Volvox carteri f. nagariensis]